MPNITLDENGKISDNDALYDLLDELYDKDEYDNIIAAAMGVPEEQRSVKLRFRMINALSNNKDFETSLRELEKIYPDCKKPDELARFYYNHGYIRFMNDKEMSAQVFYEAGAAADPENTSGLDLPDEVEECRQATEKDLMKLENLAGKAVKRIDERCAEKREKRKMSDGEFTVLLGLVPSMRPIPAVGRPLGLNDFFVEFQGEERENVSKWLESVFGIKDKNSFINFYRSSRGCNIQGMFADVKALFRGKPNFDVNTLNKEGQRAFLHACMFIKPISKYLPEAGVIGWDLSEKAGFSRLAFSCGALAKDDYLSCMAAIKDAAKQNFSSAAEFLKSLVIGSALYMFASDEWTIKGAIEHMQQTLSLMLRCALPDCEW
ncbi:MAG: DUF1266 domain-containing protein [Lachnospiraceae bacterium]|nr:DUF1266 domain-containing protein [Ruminococcus sp.]MCM1275836.1 DUF1266 domain-containing protein [Lachnospiraceae bacterium]